MAGEEHELVTATHGQIAAVFSAAASFLTALTMRLTRKDRPSSETQAQREKRLDLERKLADAEAALLDARFEKIRAEFLALLATQNSRIDGLQQQNGAQGRDLEIAEKDINNLWRLQRGEPPKP